MHTIAMHGLLTVHIAQAIKIANQLLRISWFAEDSSTALASFQPLLAFLLILCSAKKAQNLVRKMSIKVLISCTRFLVMTSQKLYQHHVIEIHKHAVDTCCGCY